MVMSLQALTAMSSIWLVSVPSKEVNSASSSSDWSFSFEAVN